MLCVSETMLPTCVCWTIITMILRYKHGNTNYTNYTIYQSELQGLKNPVIFYKQMSNIRVIERNISDQRIFKLETPEC